jgi:translation elongation factor EF-G
MSSPSSERVKRIHVYGHVSASPQAIANTFSGSVASVPESESDLAIFAVNPAAGIDQPTINNWSALDDFQIPRLVVVNGLDGHEMDFEDAVMVANRVFDQLVTPYLVLHDDAGQPAALIRMQDLQIVDYTTNPPTLRHSEPEHEELVREFRDEYFEKMAEMDEGAFAAGIIFPAIPINLEKGIGLDIVNQYIDSLPSSS